MGGQGIFIEKMTPTPWGSKLFFFRPFTSVLEPAHSNRVIGTVLLLGGGNVHKTFIAVALGATLALVMNKTLSGIINTVLAPLGLTYA